MASTNPFPPANSDAIGNNDSATTRASRRRGKRNNRGGRKNSGKSSAKKLRPVSRGFEDWPSFKSLQPALVFLCLPVLIIVLSFIMGGLPKPVLYLSGLIIGVIVAMSVFKSVEITVLCILLYLPFAKLYVIPVLPGLNGTNMIIMLGLGAAFILASREKVPFVVWPPGSALVISFGVYTALSGITVLQHPGGVSLLMGEILSYKSWLDQFIIYLILVALIRDRESAKRAVIYIMLGSAAVVIFSIPELLEKMGRSSIERSRLLGPQMQSNNFGGFLAYTMLPMLAFFMVYMKEIRAWLTTPYFLIAIQVLITTFSRGAYVALVAGGFMIGYYRGKVFLLGCGILAISIILAFPAVIPDSILARMDGLIGGGGNEVTYSEEEKLDQSSSTRLLLWEAAGTMMAESPILGKGFKSFQFLKPEYVPAGIVESDPHSMYLYLGSQMGTPALLLFIAIMFYMFKLGRFHSLNKHDNFIRAVGIGGTAIPICYAVVCLFGSRAVALNFTIYFWAYLVVLQVLKKTTDEEKLEKNNEPRAKRPRRITAGLEAKSALALESGNTLQLEMKRGPKNRKGRRMPKRGAAAYLAHQAEQKSLEAINRVENQVPPAEAPSSGKSLTIQTSSTEQPVYETRAVRRAREAAEKGASAGRQRRQR